MSVSSNSLDSSEFDSIRQHSQEGNTFSFPIVNSSEEFFEVTINGHLSRSGFSPTAIILAQFLPAGFVLI